MQSTDLYSFIVLRDPERSQTGASHPRLVNAWSAYQSEEDARFRDGISADYTRGGVRQVRQRARNLLNGLHQHLVNGRLRQSLSNSRVFDDLRALALRGAEADAEKLVTEWLTGEERRQLKDGWLAEQRAPLAAARANFADALLAAVLTDSSAFDREDAAFNLCAYEAIERLIDGLSARPPASAAWIRPLIDGIVCFPFLLARPKKPQKDGVQTYRAKNANKGDELPADVIVSAAAQVARQYVGDLVLLKQTLRGYRLGEIAHIENVLKTEQYQRVYRALRRNEVRSIDETETESVTERDLQTTEREEFKREMQRAQRDELAISANLSATVMGKTPVYTVVVSAGASASFRRTTEQRELVSQAHARETVQRVQQRLTERVRTVREALSVKENEDTATHGFDNKEGEDHVIGVYRWVEKQSDLHLVNYGRRMFLEFMVPEPAAYWRALQARRTQVAVGPPPERPRLPKLQGQTQGELLAVTHFALDVQNGEILAPEDFPARWNELVALAAEWGVVLDDPPRAELQKHYTLSVDPLQDDTSSSALHKFGTNNTSYYYESVKPRTKIGEEPLTIPEGYATNSGEFAIKPWMAVGKRDEEWKQYEGGWAVVTIGGRRFGFGVGKGATTQPGLSYDDATGFVQSMDTTIFTGYLALSGEVQVGLTTVLNGVVCSVRLNCRRTQRWADLWAAKMYSRFMQAWQQRMADHADKASRAQLDDAERDYVRPAAVYREIERREIKRTLVDLLLAQQLDELGDGVLDDALPPNIAVQQLPTYTRIVEFLERVFDWPNLVYTFMPYFYGRKPQWEHLALASSGDADFEKFLAAGAARVQLPTIPGYEAAVNAFLNGFGALDPGQMIPWLATGRPIAEDLARAARDGFELSAGRLSVPTRSRLATITGTAFSDPGDLNREIRIGTAIYLVRRIVSPTSLELDREVPDALNDVEFETGGIVIGPPIPIVLPTTLVAIDTASLSLPQFPGRYG